MVEPLDLVAQQYRWFLLERAIESLSPQTLAAAKGRDGGRRAATDRCLALLAELERCRQRRSFVFGYNWDSNCVGDTSTWWKEMLRAAILWERGQSKGETAQQLFLIGNLCCATVHVRLRIHCVR